MSRFLHNTLQKNAAENPSSTAIIHKDQSLTYQQLLEQSEAIASSLAQMGVQKGERVALWLPKRVEAIVAIYAISLVGAIFVPINPVLKPRQVQHILRDCAVKALISDGQRMQRLSALDHSYYMPEQMIQVDHTNALPCSIFWSELLKTPRIDFEGATNSSDVAAILYTSGSTGSPKGVMLSHHNLLLGSESVVEYLSIQATDRILAVLPLSFDYGLNQVISAIDVGASVILLEFLMPGDVIKAVSHYKITGLAAVPPLWNQLSHLTWAAECKKSLRYITNSGGHLGHTAIEALQAQLPDTDIYVMYGLTEAFRSTYLEPKELNQRIDSIGKAIPHAEIRVLNEYGHECAADEVGELVHLGDLVAQGYWLQPEQTEATFRQLDGKPALWSGDMVRRDADDYLYFVARGDELIKSSGYRISPDEVEDCALEISGVMQAVAMGVPDPQLGQAILLLVEVDSDTDEHDIRKYMNAQLPRYMLPRDIEIRELPRNANGKIDRTSLRHEYLFQT